MALPLCCLTTTFLTNLLQYFCGKAELGGFQVKPEVACCSALCSWQINDSVERNFFLLGGAAVHLRPGSSSLTQANGHLSFSALPACNRFSQLKGKRKHHCYLERGHHYLAAQLCARLRCPPQLPHQHSSPEGRGTRHVSTCVCEETSQ